MLFTLVWATATKFPKVMVATARIMKASCQSDWRAGKAKLKTLTAATKPIFLDPAVSREEQLKAIPDRHPEPTYEKAQEPS